MNPATRRALLAAAADKARRRPADVRRPLAQGARRYRSRLWAIHAAVIMLAAVMLGVGLLTLGGADSLPENTPPPTGSGSVLPSSPIGSPEPTDTTPIDPGPTDPRPTDTRPADPRLVQIRLDPSMVSMAPGDSSSVRATGIYDNGPTRPIPVEELSWRITEGEGEGRVPGVVSVGPDPGTVIAIRPGRATLVASLQDVEGTAEITVSGGTEGTGSTPPSVTASPLPVIR
ncbi:hypothetical protein [Kocuria sp. NPDC057446]|uniref:hypothetical protein n=1 Tax=Kocuria sp. NPDC057446 TaxID=3346137 RepID=UPI0036D09CFC